MGEGGVSDAGAQGQGGDVYDHQQLVPHEGKVVHHQQGQASGQEEGDYQQVQEVQHGGGGGLPALVH